jgi:hypothetical protein
MPDDANKAWREATEAALERLYPGVKASSIPERVWTNLYIRGLNPNEAARGVDLHTWNKLTPFERLRRAKEGSPRQRLAEAILGGMKPTTPSVKRTTPKLARQKRGKRAPR